jgi:hypothetical protein
MVATRWTEGDRRQSFSNAETGFSAPHKIRRLNAFRRMSRIDDELGFFNDERIVAAEVVCSNHKAAEVWSFIHRPAG